MGCGCTNTNPCVSTPCGCPSCTNCLPVANCATVCTALVVTNAWNVPACDASAILSIPGLTTVLIGSYIFNPTYGFFRITAFDSVNGQLTVLNECLDGNAIGGTVVPANTLFVFGAPPGATNVTFSGYAGGTNYSLTAVSAPVVFGTTQPLVTLTSPGTYLLLANLTFSGNGVTTAGVTTFDAALRRQNNTPANLIGVLSVAGTQGAQTAFTGTYSSASLPPFIYTTINSNDIISINANYTGSVPSVGNFAVNIASVVAVKLS